jgi:DegV family protein with EDD domain
MQKVLIMTDTVACIPKDLADEYQIKVVPAALISFNGYEYIEGVTLSATEAYQLITKDPDRFVTSPPTPAHLVEEYSKIATETQDILFITLSSALSAVSKVAGLAADIMHERSPQIRIKIFDSKSCAGGEGLVVMAAAKAAKKGMELEQLVDVAEKVRQHTKSLMILDTLRYIYRTGRLSKEDAHKAAEANIKPINRVADNGTVEFVDSVTDREVGYNRLIELIQQEAGTKSLHFMLNHAAAPDMVEVFRGMLKNNFDCLSLTVSDYSPVMGYGAGPGALFVAFHPELDLLK